MADEEDTEAAIAAALEQDADSAVQDEPTILPEPAEAASFDDLGTDAVEPAAIDPSNPDLDVILDIPVQISMVVGNSQISIRNLLQLNQGSVVELDRLAGEPLDVLVNNTLVAHGEVVVVNEKYGIRLTDVVSAAERIRNLG